jgi:hypothetical protein
MSGVKQGWGATDWKALKGLESPTEQNDVQAMHYIYIQDELYVNLHHDTGHNG